MKHQKINNQNIALYIYKVCNNIFQIRKFYLLLFNNLLCLFIIFHSFDKTISCITLHFQFEYEAIYILTSEKIELNICKCNMCVRYNVRC